MPTKLAIDDRLLQEALEVGGHKTKNATIAEGLEEHILRRKQASIVPLFGTIEMDPSYDSKKQRRRT